MKRESIQESKAAILQEPTARSREHKFYLLTSVFCLLSLLVTVCFSPCGCSKITGYYNSSLYPQDVRSVYLEMFDVQSFRRGVEYELTDALAKRIEADTPYKIISSPDRADTIMTGNIQSVTSSVLSIEREGGQMLENEVELRVVINWKNLKTGELLIDNELATARATYSSFQNQDFNYGSALAANNVAQRIVELMQKKW